MGSILDCVYIYHMLLYNSIWTSAMTLRNTENTQLWRDKITDQATLHTEAHFGPDSVSRFCGGSVIKPLSGVTRCGLGQGPV